MTWHHIYVQEKLREIEQLNSKRHEAPVEQRGRPKPVVGPVALRAGRVLRRFGEGLESWAASPTPECPESAQYR
jgi:hypothetical protein